MSCHSSTVDSLRNKPAEIGVRNAHAMVYDSDRKRVVLFGGADESKVCNDTWEWDGKVWTRVAITGPAPRTFPAMTYDNIRKRVVLFGGNRVLFGNSPAENTFLDDTWEWNGKTWQQIKVKGPVRRAEAVMSFDSNRGCAVLFGGHNLSGTTRQRLGDTWELDGVKWRLANNNGPSPRNGAAQVYDTHRKRVLLFGGSTADSVSGEIWEWDGKDWTENKNHSSEGRFNAVMAYDIAQQQVIRFGGRYKGKPLGDTWKYDINGWSRLNVSGPSPRNHSAMVYDAHRKKMVLFGGHDLGVSKDVKVYGDTWEWNGTSWNRIYTAETKTRVENGH